MSARNARYGPVTRTTYHHGDLRRALLHAARTLIDAGGDAALTLRAAAQEAGVSAAAPYRHFADREALLAAVLAEGFRALAATTEDARAAAPEPIAAFLAVGDAYLRFAQAHPRLYRLMFGPECNRLAHPQLVEAGKAAFAVVLQSAHDCARAGALGARRAEDVALAGWTTVHGLASLQVDGILDLVLPPQPLGDRADALFSILVEGIVPRAARTTHQRA